MAKQKETPTAADLDETAELPIIPGGAGVSVSEDPLVATDAYNAPTVFRAPPAIDDIREARIAQREAEIGALRSDLASVTESRGQLENNLGNLTTNLRDLEQMLNTKSEQLSMFEREVGQRDRRISELAARNATLDGELAAKITERDSLRVERDSLRVELQAVRADIESSHQRISELEARTATLDGALAATTAERDTLRLDLRVAREDADSSRQLIKARDASEGALLKEREQQNRRVRQLETDIAQARANAERYRERLQSMEGRRQIFASMLDEREAEVIERGTTLVKLESEMTQRTRFSAARESDLKGLLSAEQERVRQLEQAAIISRTEQESLRLSLTEAARAADERVASVRAELESQQAAMAELRAQLAAVNSSLDERNALIERLETEMQSSSQVLGSIQHNLQHLGDAEPTRMLVRTQGETGIVHMLGRRTTLGRTPDNDIRIDEDFISRHHAVLLMSGLNTIVEDLNSTNGTYVNGERINRRTLKEGDLVTLGKTEFRFVVKKASDKPA
ncbi:MAG TPA: FHA domain-containing protein [Steroidobacteraceae bacterium]|jgi:chromosome segregation ATPase|nr:FHA domain-containing protein [Steroidobacteraceae bacterium]